MELSEIKMQLTYMSDDDIEAVKFALQRGYHIPAYSMVGTAHDGTAISWERHFSPVQMRQITDGPYPECLTEANCRHLVTSWNGDGRGNYHYEYLG